MEQLKKHNTLYNIENLGKALVNSSLKSESLEKLINENETTIKDLASVLQLNPLEVVVASIAFNCSLSEENICNKSISRYLNSNLSFVLSLHPTIENLVKKGYLIKQQNVESQQSLYNPFGIIYKLSPLAYRVIMNESTYSFNLSSPLHPHPLEIAKHINESIAFWCKNGVSYAWLYSETVILLEQYKNFHFAERLLALKFNSTENWLVLVKTCLEFILERRDIYLEDFCASLPNSPVTDQLYYSLTEGYNPLITENWLLFKRPFEVNYYLISPTKRTVNEILINDFGFIPKVNNINT